MQNLIRYFYLLIILCLISCGQNASLATPIVDSVPTATASLIPPTLSPTETLIPVVTSTPLPTVKRVMIISFDGLRPDAIQAAEMTNLLSLMQNGSYSLTAQTILPSLTLPAHSSMLVGTCPAKHIARWNEYVPENGYALGTDIFDLAKAAGLRTVFVAGKEKLRQVTEPQSTDFFGFVDATDKIEDKVSLETMAIEEIRKGFDLMFLHFPDGDLAGHKDGWMSRQQLLAYLLDDKSLGLILDVLKSRNLYDDTLFIITSDHGGHDTTHGTDLPEDLTIPWVISGPGIIQKQLQTQVYIMDTAATVAFALGLPIPAEWDGIPVYEAFGLPVDSLRDGGCTGTP
ncbi:MAG: alkaline phosphatase family protein [Anaerolineales bacterium]|nr:alkaline phosphatase family protein [Anaerolineales bacterium]